jgi:glycosyltransferase involved in cell wall biosynthesis
MSAEAKPVVLTLLAVFWPGNDASGPNQSFRAMAEALSDNFTFRVVSRDRRYGAQAAERPSGVWTVCDGISTRYAAMGLSGATDVGEILRSTPHDVLVMNGFYDRDFTIPTLLLRALGRVPKRPVILSPRGEFAPGASSLKSVRKRVWRETARRLGLLSDVWLHATSEAEAGDIRRGFPWGRGVLVAPNIRKMIEPLPRQFSTDGITRLTFLGRISPVKNLDYALAALEHVCSPVKLRIYGPCQDAVYWEICRKIIARLPAHISVTYRGEIANSDVPAIMADTDLFFLPTKGENFGHSIFEALSCSVPVLVSDATPWRDLEAQAAGWDEPLSDPVAFARRIDEFTIMGEVARERLRSGARVLAEQSVRESDALVRTRAMLLAAMGVDKSTGCGCLQSAGRSIMDCGSRRAGAVQR